METIKQEIMLMLNQSKRINVIRYFSFVSFSIMVLIAIFFLSFLAGKSVLLNFVILTSIVIGSIIFIIFNILWLMRRLNDISLSGYWVLIPIIIEILTMTAGFMSDARGGLVVVIFGFGLALLISLVFAIIPGSKTMNHYGEIPPPNNLFNYFFFLLLVLFILFLSFRSTAEEFILFTQSI